ncbi:MAG TPA: cysteine desulfurase [Chitinophagales bacterium]|nr:cysteine desulfurase [Chitinophagales bacterium]
MTPTTITQKKPAASSFNVEKIREEFPLLHQKVNGFPLVYFDNAATSQKPRAVIDAINQYYSIYNSNVHRGVHYLSGKATDAYEESRRIAQRFINAKSEVEVNFTRGTTESVNLVAQTWGRKYVKQGDEVIISALEHHSNTVPWQMLCEEKGARLRVIPMNDAGELLLDEYDKLLNERTRIVAVTHVSNALGTVNPVRELIRKAHSAGAIAVIDGAQSVQHLAIDVQALDCDFFCFSGHKVFGPTGIGILYGKEKLLDDMPPWQGGGEMIKQVTFEKTTYNELPYKFEAGTPNIEGGIGLGAALNYVSAVGLENIYNHEHDLLQYGTQLLQDIEGVRIYGTARDKASVISFLVDDIHPYDFGVILDKMGIAIRTGHHCCQPLMDRLQIEGTCRASFAFYNTREELDRFAQAVRKAKSMF